jgi:glutamyl-Q tRNA(Asp) synthetase
VSDARSSSATATTGTAEPGRPYRGRFAPSPSGPLHFGSLVAAVGSFLEARVRGGQWLVRIEDLDPPRERPGAADDILRTLDHLGLHWDGPVLRQSARSAAYEAALERLGTAGRLRSCLCSRGQLTALPANQQRGPGEELFHPPQCLAVNSGMTGRPPALRFRAPDCEVEFVDRVQGRQRANVARSVGDFVLKRSDGLFAYQLAVVVDDAEQGVTDIVRGADLLSSTPRQIVLQDALGLRPLTYMHLPIAVSETGLKLSKSEDAPALSRSSSAAQIVAALEFLRQAPPAGLERAPLAEVWQWANAHWQPERIAGIRTGRVTLEQGAHEQTGSSSP